MKLNRTRALRIDFGSYEGSSPAANVTVDHTDLGYSDEDVLNMSDEQRLQLRHDIQAYAEDWLRENLLPELRAAALDAKRDSFVHSVLGDYDAHLSEQDRPDKPERAKSKSNDEDERPRRVRRRR